ncbi:MAG: glycosyltransferase family 39 protein [Candidatus Nanoarchaeia archaeon]
MNPYFKKETWKAWFADNYNKIFIAIFILAIAVRLYYHNVNSAVWWDEADYLSSALHWFFDVPYKYNPQRGVLFPLLIGILFKLGLSESVTKFFVVLLPSAGIVVLTYLIGKQMYDKKVGVVAAGLMSTFWVSLFWTPRFSNDFLAFFFQLAAIYCFWRGVMYQQGKGWTWLFGLFLGLGFITRAQSILIAGALLMFLLIVQKLSFLKNKDLWISVLFFFIPVLPYFMWLSKNFGSFFAFSAGYSSQVISDAPFGWYVLNFPYLFLGMFLFVFFIIGLLSLADLILGFDLVLKKEQKNAVSADLFWLLTSFIILIFFIFWIRGTEDRWVILLSVPLFFFASKGMIFISDLVKKKNIKAASIVLLLLVAGGMYIEWSTAHPLIMTKKDTYVQVKDAALWMKINSNSTDLIYSPSGPQTIYYSEREVVGFPAKEEEFFRDIALRKPKYMTLSVFERYADWVNGFPEKYPDVVMPVNGWFADAEHKQPLMVVFEFKKYEK